jgi:hypothetical protein
MKSSGIIYPNPKDSEPVSDVSMVNDNDGIFLNKTGPGIVGDNPYLISRYQENADSSESWDEHFVDISGSAAFENQKTLLSEGSENLSETDKLSNADEGNTSVSKSENSRNVSDDKFIEHKEFVVNNYSVNDGGNNSLDHVLDKMQKSPYRKHSDGSRRFNSKDFGSDNRYKPSGYGKDENYAEIRQDRLKDDTHSPGRMAGGDKKDGSFERQSQRRLVISDRHPDSKRENENAGKRRFALARKNESGDSSGKVKKAKEKSFERREKSDGMILSLMFVFEIFRWLLSTDIIVRFIIAVIAGVVGFGIIFSQAGALSSF